MDNYQNLYQVFCAAFCSISALCFSFCASIIFFACSLRP